MQDLLQQLLDHVRGLWRFRRWGMAVAWAVCAIGWLVVIALPPVYEANSRVVKTADEMLSQVNNMAR
jgi:uncharacterized protein involved in exopolysaccharide biosynthesis